MNILTHVPGFNVSAKPSAHNKNLSEKATEEKENIEDLRPISKISVNSVANIRIGIKAIMDKIILTAQQLKTFYILDVHGTKRIIKAVNEVELEIRENE